MAHWRTRPLDFIKRWRQYDGTPPSYTAGIWGPTTSGSNITEESAMSISTVYACVAKISSTLSALGVEIYSKSGDVTTLAVDHPAHRVVALEPNERQTPYEFWEEIISSAAMYGMGYAIINRSPNGYASSLTPVHFNSISRADVDGSVMYKVNALGLFSGDDILEVTNLHRTSPIKRHRDNLGLTKSAQDFGSSYFGNGGRMTGVLRPDDNLDPEQMEMLQNSWNAATAAGGTKVLPAGVKYDRISISPEEAQFIFTRKYQQSEICQIWDVSPAMVHVDSNTTYANNEQQALNFRNSLLPWMRRIEQEINRKLLPSFDRPGLFARFTIEDLFRGDSKARSDYFTTALQNGWMNINEVRARENLNPCPGGSVFTVQINQIALDRLGAYSDKISSQDNGSSN